MSHADRLDSWKEIASYLRRGVRTAQRWEREAALPVRRVAGDGAVYAFRSELDAWWQRQAAAGGAEAIHGRPAPSPIGDRAPAPRPLVRPFLSHEVRVDPESAPAHAELAVYFFTLTMVGLMPPHEGLAAARGAASRALQLEADRAEAHAMLGVVAALYDRDWNGAERHWQRAFARKPVPAMVRFHYSPFYLEPLGRYAESLANLEPALAADPLYLLGRVERGTAMCALGRVDEGLAEFELVCRMDPQFAPAVGYLAREHALAGRLDEARACAETAFAAAPRHPNAAGMLAGISARTGDADRARAILDAHATERGWSLPRARAEAALACGRPDEAMAHIAAAVDARDPGVWILFSGSARPLLEATPRWRQLRVVLNLPA